MYNYVYAYVACVGVGGERWPGLSYHLGATKYGSQWKEVDKLQMHHVSQ